MGTTLPSPPAPGTVRVTLAGDAQDILKFSIFLEAVTRRHDPSEAMANLHLAAIVISDVRNTRDTSTGHMTMLVQLLASAA